MGTLATNRKGKITGNSASSYENALAQTTGVPSDQETSSTVAMQYFASSGRGGGTFRFIRTYLHFNTSGISAGSNFIIQVTSTGANGESTNNVTAIKHSAGGSNGGELATTDFDNLDRNTPYSSSTEFPNTGTVSINLNAAAATQIINNNDFNVALLLAADAAADNEPPIEEDGDVSNSINFGNAINLTYTDAVASGYTHKVNAVAATNIGKVNTVATASIGKINTVD